MHRPCANLLVAVLVAACSAGEALGQNWRTVTMSRQLKNEQSVDVDVHYSSGRLSVSAAEEGTLYWMQLEYDEDRFEPVADYGGSSIRIGTESRGRRIRIGKNHRAGNMELELSRDVSMDLDMEFGAVRADIDLGGLRLSALDITAGASQTRVDISEPNAESMSRASMDIGAAEFTVRHLGNLNAAVIDIDAGVGHIELDFTGEWQRDARVSVDMGLGSLVLRFPKELGVRLVKDTFLTSLDSEGLVKRGDTYYSLDYDDAEYRVTVNVDAAFGSIRVLWVR